MVTLLDEHERVDEKAFREHLNHLIDAGVHGVFVLGTAGEGIPLLDAERGKVIEIAVRETNNRVPVFVGVMDVGTKRMIQNAEIAQELGADAIVATLPCYYTTDNSRQVIEHFTAIAESVDLPVMLYNIPQTVKSIIDLDAVLFLSQVDNIAGIKESQEDWERVQQLLVHFGENDDFAVLVGSEILVCAAMLFGGNGGVLGISNVIPRIAVNLYNAAKRGDIQEAFAWQKKMMSVQQIYSHGFWLTCQKAAVSLLGYGEFNVTAPLPGLSSEALEGIRQVLKEEGIALSQTMMREELKS